MSKSITYSPLPDPGGLSPKEWAREVRRLAAKGWLQDPDLVAWDEDPMHPVNVKLREEERVCLSVCWRGRCRKAGRCLTLIRLAIRENRHKLWPDTWKERAANATTEEIGAFVPVDLVGKLPFCPNSFSPAPRGRRIASRR